MRDKHIADSRIHAALYFIAPTGHTLKAIDVLVMKKLSEVVNVIPVIAKSDSLTLEEREAFKERVRFVPPHPLHFPMLTLPLR
jgi:septin 3/9/12